MIKNSINIIDNFAKKIDNNDMGLSCVFDDSIKLLYLLQNIWNELTQTFYKDKLSNSFGNILFVLSKNDKIYQYFIKFVEIYDNINIFDYLPESLLKVECNRAINFNNTIMQYNTIFNELYPMYTPMIKKFIGWCYVQFYLLYDYCKLNNLPELQSNIFNIINMIASILTNDETYLIISNNGSAYECLRKEYDNKTTILNNNKKKHSKHKKEKKNTCKMDIITLLSSISKIKQLYYEKCNNNVIELLKNKEVIDSVNNILEFVEQNLDFESIQLIGFDNIMNFIDYNNVNSRKYVKNQSSCDNGFLESQCMTVDKSHLLNSSKNAILVLNKYKFHLSKMVNAIYKHIALLTNKCNLEHNDIIIYNIKSFFKKFFDVLYDPNMLTNNATNTSNEDIDFECQYEQIGNNMLVTCSNENNQMQKKLENTCLKEYKKRRLWKNIILICGLILIVLTIIVLFNNK
jgi:hypothetical protein